MSEIIIEGTQRVVEIRNSPGPQGPPGAADDGDVAAAVTSGPLTTAALNSTYAAAGRSVVGNKWVFLGDSITAGSAGGGETFIRYSSVRSEQRIREARNAGVPSDTAALMLARFDTAVTPFNPDVVHVLAGTNDAGALRLLSDYAADMRAILAKIRAIGALPVIGSIPPRGVGAQQSQMDKIRAFNGWLSRWTAVEGVTFVDYYGALIDPATGFLKASFDADIVHPTNLGHYAMATELLKVKDAMPYRPPLLPLDVGDTGNILTNGLMYTDVQPDGFPDSWGGGSGSTATVGFTHSIVDDPKFSGRAAQVALSSANGFRKFSQGVSSARWAAGQKLAVVARFSIISPTGLTGSDGLKMQLVENGSTIRPVLTDLKQSCDGAVMYQEYDVAAGVTSLTLEILFNANGAGKTVTYRIGQIGVYNLSASGALT